MALRSSSSSSLAMASASVLNVVTPVTGPDREGGAFSVVFRGPVEPVVEQATHLIEIESAGEAALFIVPLGPDGDGMLYEAVFN